MSNFSFYFTSPETAVLLLNYHYNALLCELTLIWVCVLGGGEVTSPVDFPLLAQKPLKL